MNIRGSEKRSELLVKNEEEGVFLFSMFWPRYSFLNLCVRSCQLWVVSDIRLKASRSSMARDIVVRSNSWLEISLLLQCVSIPVSEEIYARLPLRRSDWRKVV